MRRQRYFDGKDNYELRILTQEKTGYMLAGNGLMSQAFRRSSYCRGNGGKSNEILEFLGDRVLNYFTVKIVAERCGAINWEGDYAFRICQNRFSVLQQQWLSNEAFARIADEWGIADYLIVGEDDEKNEVHKQTKIKADLFEAIIGAIAIECKWNDEVLEKVVRRALNLDARIEEILQNEQALWQFDMDNAVTKLKELAEKEQCSPPSYEITGPENLGYDKNGDPVWICSCSVTNDRTGISLLVRASSKKEAKKAAAYLVLCQHFEVANIYGVSQGFGRWIYKKGKLMPDTPQMREEIYNG